MFSILAAFFGAILVKTTILGTNSTQKNDFDKVFRSKSTAIYTEHSYENCFKIVKKMQKNEENSSKIKRDKLLKSVMKKAVGYVSKEYVEEYNVVEGDLVLTKKKVSTKDIPPDTAAIKLLLENAEPQKDVTLQDLENERKELMEQYLKISTAKNPK